MITEQQSKNLKKRKNWIEKTFANRELSAIEDCAKDGGEEFFTEMHCVRSTNL